MKIAVNPTSIESIISLSEAGADIFILGNDDYASRLTTSFTEDDIIKAIEMIHNLGKEIYISLNIIAHNENLKNIEIFLKSLKNSSPDAIIFGDLGVYMIARKLKMEHLLIYNPETLNTSTYDPIFWKRKGIKGITISKEITLQDIQEISDKSDIEISIIGHGHLNMFHSRRPLIEHYFTYTEDTSNPIVDNRKLTILEESRDEPFPIFQDKHGTHIFRGKALESFKEIPLLNETLDVFIIDSIFKDEQYLLEVLSKYKDIISKNNSNNVAAVYSKKYQKDHDSGFLYKKTVYDKY